MLAQNESMIHLEIGSINGSNPNRLGKELWNNLGLVLKMPTPLLSILNLSSTSMSTEDFSRVVDCLKQGNYRYLTHLDISRNRLFGVQAGFAVSQLLVREFKAEDGLNLHTLNLSYNKIDNDGVQYILQSLSSTSCHLKSLNLAHNAFTIAAGIVVVPPHELTIRTKLETLILDDNHVRTKAWGRFATLIAMCRSLKVLSMRNCAVEDTTFAGICDVLILTRRLQKIDMTRNRITDKSILQQGLVDLLKHNLCPPLEEILLESNMITSEGAIQIIKSCQRSVEKVNLADNRLSDDFIVFLQRFLKSQRLERRLAHLIQIEVHDNGLTCDVK